MHELTRYYVSPLALRASMQEQQLQHILNSAYSKFTASNWKFGH